MEEALHSKNSHQLAAALTQTGYWLQKQGNSKLFQAANVQVCPQPRSARTVSRRAERQGSFDVAGRL